MCEEVSKIASSFLSHDSINEAIDSLRFLGDVGDTDLHVLERILPHCTVDQLMHIENSSKGRDLTPVTDKLWKNFYEKKFGKNDSDLVIKKMKYKKESFKWKQLYEAKMEALEKKAMEIEARYKQNCQKENARKQSRKIIFCEDVSSSNNKKRRSEGTIKSECNTTESKILKKPNREAQMCQVSSGGTTKPGHRTKQSKILKKAKREALQCIETKNVIAFRRNAMQK
ncbi:uncharacterized protein LOC120076176 [Benincasa hispida]|uniref:uncharacterized protein LOC120076176 n=1 Tax=Benincasa hispida TaxID=102211 RepID=UPI001900D50C|nr:uncharacterized protein LOC120076176 [Benincasa hispida]